MATKNGYHHYKVTKIKTHSNGEVETSTSTFTAKDGKAYLDRERKSYIKLGWKDVQFKDLVEVE